MRPLTWFSVTLDGKRIPIYLSCADLTRDLRGRRGVTLGEERTRGLYAIYINVAEPRATQDHTLYHELLVHGVLWDTSLRRGLEVEERFAYALEGRAFDVLRQLGFRWPRRPRGAAALEAWARRPRTGGSPQRRATNARSR